MLGYCSELGEREKYLTFLRQNERFAIEFFQRSMKKSNLRKSWPDFIRKYSEDILTNKFKLWN